MGVERLAFVRRWRTHARAWVPVAEASRSPRPQGNRFRFPSRYRIVAKILFKFGSRSELRLYAVFESYAYMPFSSPTPICRFRVLRLYGLCADVALTAPIHRCYSEESHTEGRRPCPPSRSSCSTA